VFLEFSLCFAVLVESLRIAQKTNLEACKMTAPETSLKRKDTNSMQGFEIADAKLATTSEVLDF